MDLCLPAEVAGVFLQGVIAGGCAAVVDESSAEVRFTMRDREMAVDPRDAGKTIRIRGGLPAYLRPALKPELQEGSGPSPSEEIEAIKARMASLLRKSPAVTDGLRKALRIEDNDDERPDVRARDAISKLAESTLEAVTGVLVQLHDGVDDEAKRIIGELAADYLCLVVEEEDMASLRQSPFGGFVSVPTANETLVDVIMARHERKRPVYGRGNSWLRGLYNYVPPQLRKDPYSESEIPKDFQAFMEDKYLSANEKRDWDEDKRRNECNRRHEVEIRIRRDRRRRYFLIRDLGNHEGVATALSRNWPSVSFVEMIEHQARDKKEKVDELCTYLFLLNDLFVRDPG